MKSLPTSFQDKILSLYGTEPVVLADVTYNTSDHLKIGTRKIISVVGGTFEPYLANVFNYACGLTESDSVNFITSMTLQILRNATTDSLLTAQILKKPVEIFFTFLDLGWVSRLEFAQLLIDSISDITPTTFNLNLSADEISRDPIPAEVLSKTDYPYIMDSNVGLPVPFFLGNCQIGGGSDGTAYLLHYKGIFAPSLCIDLRRTTSYGVKFLAYQHWAQPVQSQTIRAFIYISAWKIFAEMLKNDGTANFTQSIADNKLVITLDLAGLDTYWGDFCVPRILPDRIIYYTVCETALNAIDLDSSTVATLDATNTNIIAGFSDRYSGEKTFQRHIKLSTIDYDLLVCMNITENISGVIEAFASADRGSSWTSLGTYNGTGYKEFGFNNASIVPDYDLTNIQIKIVRNSGTVKIDGLHIRFMLQKEDMGVYPPGYLPFPLGYWSQSEGPKRRGYKTYQLYSGTELYEKLTKAYPKFNHSQMFLFAKSTNADLSGYGWSYEHPIYIIYFILYYYFNANADMANFNTVYGRLNASPNSSAWSMSYIFDSAKDPLIIIGEICQMCGLKLWTDYDGDYNLFVVNYVESTTLTFSDGADGTGGAYQIKDFLFGYVEEIYNKFEIHWRKNRGSGELTEIFLEDHNTDSYLAQSWNDHNQKEVYFPVSECDFVNDATTMDYCFNMLKKWVGAKRRWVKFKCGPIGCKLDPGDTIIINHKADNWVDNAVKFQVYSIQKPETSPVYEIYALEIIA
ncbi:MAG: hypothetical protein ACOZAL_00630 [Patescibacteria group bacterium]